MRMRKSRRKTSPKTLSDELQVLGCDLHMKYPDNIPNTAVNIVLW